jgi:hypothetical protein
VTLRVRKGQPLFIPILSFNRDPAIWGENALEFKSVLCIIFPSLLIYLITIHLRPERWASHPEAASNVPGIWGHMMTFLGGPRACIGYRFSLVEYVPVPSYADNCDSLVIAMFAAYSQNEIHPIHTPPGIRN